MSEQKKKEDIKKRLEQSHKAKQPHSKMLDKKLGKMKNGAKFGKVNFSG